MNIDLYPHNQETYQKIIESWLTDNRVATVQATGTGKSMLILKCLFTYPTVNKIVLAPSHHILNQLADKVDELPNTILMTYAKLARMSEDDISSLGTKIIVLDEFHRCGAKSWGDGVSKLIANHPDAKVLGTTATPIRYLDGERDMTDELFDGKVVTNLSLPQAIVQGILPMPKYISALYTYDEEILNLHEKINNSSNTDQEKDDIRKEVEQMKKKLDKSKGIPVILKKHLGSKSGKFIVFCRDKKHLFEMKNTVIEWFIKGKVTSHVVDYSIYTGKSGNNKTIKEFRDANSNESIHLLFAIDKLNEGLHVDDIDGVIFLRSTMSPIIYYQQLGRAVTVGGKEPYVFDLVNNFSSLGSKGFASDIKEEVEKENKQRKKRGEKELELSDFVIYDEMQDTIELFGSVESRLKDSWEENYKLLVDFYKQSGHCKVRTSYKINGINLGTWVEYQRGMYRKGKLIKERVDKLDDINFEWNPIDSLWNEKFKMLCEFKEQNGHFEIPLLRTWIKKQRESYRLKKITQNRLNKLNEVGFKWEDVDEKCLLNEEKWNHNYKLLVKFINENGNHNIPSSYIIDGVKLGMWLNTQKLTFKWKKLSQRRIDKLNAIGFDWEPSKTKQLLTV